jgi:hypothetical protein
MRSVLAALCALACACSELATQRRDGWQARPEREAEPPERRRRARDRLGDRLFDVTALREVELSLEEEALDAERRAWTGAALVIDGVRIGAVEVRLKRGGGSLRALDEKPGWNIKIGRRHADRALDGITRLMLNNSVQDPSFVSEHLAYELFAAAGVAAPRSTLARLEVNGEPWGIYLLRESYDASFLDRHFADPDGNLYEAGYDIDVVDVEDLDAKDLGRETGESDDDRSDVEAVAEVVTGADEDDFLDEIEALVDLDQLARYWAVEALIYHWDGYAVTVVDKDCCSPNNYYVYRPRRAGRLVFLPHGADQTIGEGPSDAGGTSRSEVLRPPAENARLATRLFRQEAFRHRLVQAIEEVLDDWDAAALVARAEVLGRLVRDDALSGEREEVDLDEFEEAFAGRIEFLEERADIVREQLAE